MASLLTAGGLALERVIVHAIEDSTFHAVLKLRLGPGSRSAGRNAEDVWR